jgi:hypothetical protein
MSRGKKPTSSTGKGKKGSSSMNDSSAGDSKKDYEVGYCRTPIHTRFQPGQSGNPAGRRKGLRNLETDVKRMLSTPIKVKEGGRTRIKTTQEGLIMVVREKALRGNERALDRALAMAERFNNAAAEIPAAQKLNIDDQAILDAYVAERADAAITATAAKTHDDPAPRLGPDNQGPK